MQIGSLLKREIKQRKVSQRALAQMLHMDTSTLNRKLNGNRTMYLDEFATICSMLNISADRILEKTDA